MPKYKVGLAASTEVFLTFVVEASNEEEAREKVCQAAVYTGSRALDRLCSVNVTGLTTKCDPALGTWTARVSSDTDGAWEIDDCEEVTDGV